MPFLINGFAKPITQRSLGLLYANETRVTMNIDQVTHRIYGIVSEIFAIQLSAIRCLHTKRAEYSLREYGTVKQDYSITKFVADYYF